MKINDRLIGILEQYLQSRSARPSEALIGIRAFAFIFSKTVQFRNDVEVVPTLMQSSKYAGIPLLLEDLGIESGADQLTQMAQDVYGIMEDVGFDYRYLDGLDAYSVDQLLLINLAKIQRWAVVLYNRCSVSDLAQRVVDEMTQEQQQCLQQLDVQSIAFLGDSTMYSGHWSAIAAYPDIIREVFRILGRRVRIVNAGIGGNKSNQALARLDRDVIQRRVEACYVAFGGNDSQYDRQTNDFVVPLSAYQQNLEEIMNRLKAAGVQAVLGLPSKKIKYHTNVDDYLRFVDVAKTVASREPIEPFDLFNGFTDDEMPKYISEDGIHMNTEGQMRMTQIVLAHIQKNFCS